MGHAWVDVVVRSPSMDKSVSAKALVDIGATLTLVPRRIADELQLPLIGKKVSRRQRASQSLMSA